MNKLFKWTIVFTILVMMMSAAFSQENTRSRYEKYMRQLIQLSKKNPRYPFAAMIIDNKTGKIYCEGVNSSSKNPTYHGEMVAINNCAAKYPKFDWSHTTLITTAEPCSMCSSAIVWSGISKIVYGSSVTFLIEHGWNQIGINSKYVFNKSPFYNGSIVGGVLHEETDKLFENPPR